MPAPRRGAGRTVASDLASQVVIHRPNNFVSVHRYYTSAELLLRQVPPPPLTPQSPDTQQARCLGAEPLPPHSPSADSARVLLRCRLISTGSNTMTTSCTSSSCASQGEAACAVCLVPGCSRDSRPGRAARLAALDSHTRPAKRSLVVETIPRHKDFRKSDPGYNRLHKVCSRLCACCWSMTVASTEVYGLKAAR